MDRIAIALMAAAIGLGVPAVAVAPTLAALAPLQDGQWELRFRDGTPARRICLHDRWRLIQLQHPDQPCERLVLEDQPARVSVQYTCRGKGFGRTTIRRETPQLIQLETQGIAGGLPFELSAEGRRIGDCPRSGEIATPGRAD